MPASPVFEQFEFPWHKPAKPPKPERPPRFFVGDKRPRTCRWINDGRPKRPAFGITPCEERD